MNQLETPASFTRTAQSLTAAQMTAFLVLAECNNFSQAADRLGLSQPAFSQRIKQMESNFGVKLFDRSRRQVALSSHGAALLPLAAGVLRACHNAQNGMSQWKTAGTVPLRVVGSPEVMPLVTCGLLLMLRQEFGSTAMHVSEALSGVIRQQVLDGISALGVCVDIDMHPQLRYTPVLDVQMGLLVSPSCKLPETIDSLDALVDVPMIRCSEQAITTRMLRAHCPGFSAYFDAAVAVDGVQSTIELIRGGVMATVATGIGALHANASGLVFVPLPGLLPVIHVYIVSRCDAVFDTRQERLRGILRQSIHDAHWHDSVRRVGNHCGAAAVAA
jgi:DNA-binding transcriptional LysR family regulator